MARQRKRRPIRNWMNVHVRRRGGAGPHMPSRANRDGNVERALIDEGMDEWDDEEFDVDT
jgi:hypothetical protein